MYTLNLMQIITYSFISSQWISVCLSVCNFSHFDFFSRTILGQFQPNLIDTKHLWVKGIQVYSNDGPGPFPRGDIITKWRKLKIFFSRTTELISTKLGTNSPWLKGIQVHLNEGSCLIPRGDNY